MPTPLLKTLSLCLVATLIATIGSFSQSPETPTAPMTLPTDNVKLTGVDGRNTSVTVTVLSMAADRQSIVVINPANGKRMSVRLNKNKFAAEAFTYRRGHKSGWLKKVSGYLTHDNRQGGAYTFWLEPKG